MAKIIRMRPDYSCEPLWDEDTADYIESEDLQLSPGLVQRLHQWQARYDQILNLDNPRNSDFASPEEEIAFWAES